MEIEETTRMDENELSNFTGFPIPALSLPSSEKYLRENKRKGYELNNDKEKNEVRNKTRLQKSTDTRPGRGGRIVT